MKTIHKYALKPDTVISTFEGAKFLTVQMQDNQPCLWAEVDTDNEPIVKRLICFGTGHTIPESIGEYIGTVQIDDFLVFHFYEAC